MLAPEQTPPVPMMYRRPRGQPRFRLLIEVLLAGLAATATLEGATVAFPDPNLELAVRAALARPTGEIAPEEMAGLNSLFATFAGITNLAGLEAATRLTQLELSGNDLTDLRPLAGLTSLTVLNLLGNRIRDLSPLAALQQLSVVILFDNALTNISTLAALPHLTYADVRGNLLDLSPNSQAAIVIQTLASRGTLVHAQPQNSPPFLSPIRDQFTFSNHSETVTFHLSDAESPSQRLTVRARASDPVLCPAENLVFLPAGGLARKLLIQPSPGRTGLATITLTATDPQEADTRVSFNLAVVEDHPLDVSDPALESVYREALGQITRPLTWADLDSLTALNGSSRGIRDLTSLELALNLSQLNLSYNPIADYTAISSLGMLTRLFLDGNSIDNLEVLAGLPALEELSLNYNLIGTLQPLAVLTNLSSLYLNFNPIADYTGLSGLRSLRSLYLEGNGLSALPPLSSLTGLRELSLNNNSIADVTSLGALTNLHSLSLGFNPLRDLTILPRLPQLQNLHLGGTGLTNLAFLSGLTGLQSLTLANNRITEPRPLVHLTNLTFLALGFNPITDFSPLAQLRQLHFLMLQNNNLSAVDFLAPLTGLENLDLSNNQLLEASPLEALTNLSILKLGRNQLQDPGFLTNLPRLVYVDLHGNCLDLSEGSPASIPLQLLTLRGVVISDVPQRPRIDPASCRPANGFQFQFLAEAGRSYRVQVSSNLLLWIDLTNVASATPTVLVHDPLPPTAPRRFYRVSTP